MDAFVPSGPNRLLSDDALQYVEEEPVCGRRPRRTGYTVKMRRDDCEFRWTM
jgi:hypothetical protein